MEAITLHDKFTKGAVGTVILKKNGSFSDITNAWHKYQLTNNSKTIKDRSYFNIYDFVSGRMKLNISDQCDVLRLGHYTPL